jgi:hypothetical protein
MAFVVFSRIKMDVRSCTTARAMHMSIALPGE